MQAEMINLVGVNIIFRLMTKHNCFSVAGAEPNVEQFAVRFKTQELADSFQRKFEECQKNLPLSEP